MRTAYVLALVASLMIFTGCTAINGPNCGDQWDGFCAEGDCGGCGSGFARGGFSLPSFGFNRLAGRMGGGCESGNCGGGGGCDSGCCDSGGCSTSANFSDYNYDCGPMCGAYLNEYQTHDSGCGCDSCKVGQSFVKGQWSSWLGNWSGCRPRPISNMYAGVSSGVEGMTSRMAAAGDALANGIGPCRGLGSAVGCSGCNECSNGGGAIGTSHSANSGGGYGGAACGPDGCGLVGGGLAGGRIRSLFFRGNGSPHPYGGELPHTAATDGASLGGSPAPTYSYPYYTTRGPRDFLMMNPPTIGR